MRRSCIVEILFSHGIFSPIRTNTKILNWTTREITVISQHKRTYWRHCQKHRLNCSADFFIAASNGLRCSTYVTHFAHYKSHFFSGSDSITMKTHIFAGFPRFSCFETFSSIWIGSIRMIHWTFVLIVRVCEANDSKKECGLSNLKEKQIKSENAVEAGK